MTRLAVAGVTLGLALLVGLCPDVLRASQTTGPLRLHGGVTVQERALGGGIVTLREPPSVLVRLSGLELDVGSSLQEVLEAEADFARESLIDDVDERRFSDETPPRRVRVAPFYLMRTEVTVSDYDRCVRVGKCTPAGYVFMPRFRRKDLPASSVSFAQAEAYCRFRGLRLPTEAEFERAARGGERRRYPWGQLYNRRVVNHGRLGLDRTDAVDGFAELAPVASFPQGRTPEGVLDLAGNVREWTADAYSETPGGPPISGTHVLRGGGYIDPAPLLRGAVRVEAASETVQPFIGFRCARSAKTP